MNEEFNIVNGVVEDYYGSGDAVIPKGVTAIGARAFLDTDVYTVVIPEGVRVIGDSAFSACYGLTKVTLPSTVERIETQAFFNTFITSVTLPRALRFIGWSAFSGCMDLTDVTYLGTVAEFNRIEKVEPIFSDRNPTTKVRCIDGVVTLRDL